MKLIDNWRQLPRFTSVQLTAAGTGIIAVWQALDDASKAELPAGTGAWVIGLALVFLIASPIARAIEQPSLHQPPGPEDAP